MDATVSQSAAGLMRHRERFIAAFPMAQTLEDAIRSEDNPTPFFFFHKSQHADLRNCWLVLGRLGRTLEQAYAISSEVLFLFTPYVDLQRRTFNALTEDGRAEVARLQREVFGNVRFTADKRFSVLWSPDTKMAGNVKTWNSEGSRSLVVPLPPLDDATNALMKVRTAIAGVAAERDLYRGRNPVWGSEFFGREELIRKTEASLRAGRSVGLFGLRRSGKTSVVRQLQLRFEGLGTAVVLVDLESVENLDEVPIQISASLVDSLRRMKSQGKDVWVGSEQDHEARTFSELSDRLKRVAEKNSGLTIVIAIDEIENLDRLAEDGLQRVRAFLGALRRASQSVANLTLLLTGITSRYFDSSRLSDDVDNPLFGFVEPSYLASFSEDESSSLLETLGELMLLSWGPEALGAVHAAAGGFPFFVRELASGVASAARQRQVGLVATEDTFELTIADVEDAIKAWRPEAAMLWAEILKALEHYHPVMAEMCRAMDDASLHEWLDLGADADQAVQALIKLGLIRRNESDLLVRSEVLKTFQSYSSPTLARLEDVVARGEARGELLALLKEPEGPTLEFKSTARVNLHTGDVDDKISREIIKTVAAFMNTAGGTLLVGVDDAGSVLGIGKDLKTFQLSWDKYLAWLSNSLLSEAIGHALVSGNVRVESVDIDGKQVLRLDVRSVPSTPVWASWGGQDLLFVRVQNTTKELKGREIAEFCAKRLP